MEAIEKLVAYHEIENLITRYAHAFDDQDWDAFAELWTEDAVFVAGGAEFVGRKTLVDFLSTCLPPGYGGRHFCARSLIDLADDGTTATARTDVVWIPENFVVTIMARYHDQVALDGGAWRFRRREDVTVEYKPGPPPMSETAAQVSSSAMRA